LQAIANDHNPVQRLLTLQRQAQRICRCSPYLGRFAYILMIHQSVQYWLLAICMF